MLTWRLGSEGSVIGESNDPREQLQREAGRVSDRLRTLGLARLQRVDAGSGLPSAADLAHGCAQHLADLAADARGRARRPVPVLAVHALADQVAVTAQDVLAEGDDTAVRAAVSALATLRRSL